VHLFGFCWKPIGLAGGGGGGGGGGSGVGCTVCLQFVFRVLAKAAQVSYRRARKRRKGSQDAAAPAGAVTLLIRFFKEIRLVKLICLLKRCSLE
jgi:hypothetical protein